MAKVRGRTKIKGRIRAKMDAKKENQAKGNPSLHQPLTLGVKCANSGCAAAIVGKVTNAQIVIRHLATCSRQDPANLGIHANLHRVVCVRSLGWQLPVSMSCEM